MMLDGQEKAVVDEAMLLELKDIMEDDFSLLLETYLNDAAVRLDVMASAIQASQANELREAAHSFKGSCANIGALHLSGLASDLEQSAKSEAWDGIPAQHEVLQAHYTQVKARIERELADCR